MPQRREFLKSACGAVIAALWSAESDRPALAAEEKRSGGFLPVWETGVLEIHHIDTGRGNSTLVLGPDGTSLLIDAGEAHSAERTMSPARPNASRRAGEWIARYVQRQLNRIGSDALDLMLLTHLHGDHVGEVTASSPQSKRGNYRLTGTADVAETVPIKEVIDRGWPDYSYPTQPKDATALNYIALVQEMARRGTKVSQARVGSTSQLALRQKASKYPSFHARVLSANGKVWPGEGENATARFPPVEGLSAAAMPTENMCCVALRLQYSGFRYYTGGDLTSDTDYGRFPWHDIETPVAEAAGPVSVAVANHHGYFDACGPSAVRALRPRVWILPTWHVSHPAMSVLANLFSEELYSGERSVFATGMTPEALLTNERFSRLLKSNEGHVVVRVPREGREFTVFVVDSKDERGSVTATFGPFAI
jgi:L-ascorbate metabolism protein UlaG (beta-lactamase superfamily)